MGPLPKSWVLTDWGQKGTPWHFWEDLSRLTGVPQKDPIKKHEIRSNPISADPICPFPSSSRRMLSHTGELQWSGLRRDVMGDPARGDAAHDLSLKSFVLF